MVYIQLDWKKFTSEILYNEIRIRRLITFARNNTVMCVCVCGLSLSF